MIKYSFVIPVKGINEYIRESVPKILTIQRDDFEVIIYPDESTDEAWPKTRQIATGHVGPAQKRDLAVRDAKGEILIFIDDDAYPQSNILDILDKEFRNETVGAVGGPAITPPNDSFWQKVSGAVFLSSLSGGNPERYVSVGKRRFVNDWPSVNLSMRKHLFEKIGGFDSKFWPGEDTKLCLDLIYKTGTKIIYNPDVIVWHHRREGFLRHLKQIAGYGIHRGFFAKKYPKTSFKLKYFIPSFFLCFVVIGGITSFFSEFVLKLYLLGWGAYVLALLKAFFDIYRHEKNPMVVFHATYYIFFTHLVYGLRFIQGFIFTENLRSKLR